LGAVEFSFRSMRRVPGTVSNRTISEAAGPSEMVMSTKEKWNTLTVPLSLEKDTEIGETSTPRGSA